MAWISRPWCVNFVWPGAGVHQHGLARHLQHLAGLALTGWYGNIALRYHKNDK